ncbi:MAG: hypothetical protein V1874_13825 [Spirochaetota bacterium]
MKTIVLLISSLILVMFGCASFQEPVDDSLLNEMTQPEKDNISAVKNIIIVKKNEKDSAGKVVEISEQSILVSNSRMSVINVQKDYYLKKEKLYLLSGDAAKLQEARRMIKVTDEQAVKESANKDYCISKRDADLAGFKMKEAELSVVVSQLDFEKAKIAREFQIRRYGEKYDKLVDSKKFDDYYNSMQDNLNKRKQEYQKTLDSLKTASDKLKATGYEEQK